MAIQYKIENINLLSVENVKINLKVKIPDVEKTGILVITHGYGEHSGYYEDFSDYFASKGFVTAYYDLRSYGLSEGKRGHVPSFDLFLDDLDNIISYVKGKFENIPIFLFGHSMGGSIVLNYLLKRNSNNISKAIISSPWLKLAFEPPRSKLLLARIGKILFPSFAIKGELKIEHLSRDEKFRKRYEHDSLTYDLISPMYYFEIREAGLWALSNAKKLKTPILISHGDDDKVTSMKASKEFCDKAGEMCTFKKWENGYRHVVFSENDKDKIFEFFYAYLVQK
ncbi:MAG TPA: alpha/beta hydrolase [Bacteroidetes bacterium]|nr:alpha/beta hydrolase [Bacteroidota bacterium]